MSLSLWEKSPAAILLMIFTTVIITLGFMNLILTVIVEQAADARAKDLQEMAHQKSHSREEALKDLLRSCEKIDKNGDGLLSISEVIGGYERSKVFRQLMAAMDMTETDLRALFQMADPKRTGLIDYHSFCNELLQLQGRDVNMLLAMLRFNMQGTQDMLKEISPRLEELAKQGQTFSAQISVLDQKIEQLVLSARQEHTQDNSPGATSYEIGVHPSAQEPLGDSESCAKMHHSSTQGVPWQTAGMQEWDNFHELQQELQNLLDTSRFLLSKAVTQVDISLPRLTVSLSTLMRAEGTIDSLDIKTLEVWLLERKYQQYKSPAQT